MFVKNWELYQFLKLFSKIILQLVILKNISFDALKLVSKSFGKTTGNDYPYLFY